MDNGEQREIPAREQGLPPAFALRQENGDGRRRAAVKIGFFCAASLAVIWFFAFSNVPSLLSASELGNLVAGQTAPETPRSVMQLRYFSCHPFNLIYRMSLQTIFGLPGETIGSIPMFYSNYELEVVLRTMNSSTTPRNWTDPRSFAREEPSAAFMYAAAFLTLPRTTLAYAWMHDHNGAYKLLRNLRVDVVGAADKLTLGGLGAAVRALGLKQQALFPAGRLDFGVAGDSGDAPAPPSSASARVTGTPLVEGGERAAEEALPGPAQQRGLQALGVLLWPLAAACPGLLTSYFALALAEVAPLVAGWVFLTGLVKAFCEVRVLIHIALLVWRRRPQAAVQSLACSHGVPFMLGCHALLLLRLAGALLPGRVFMYLSFYLYGTWVPLVSAGITLMALQPNNAQFLEGAMDGLLHRGGGHRAAEEQHPTANGGANDEANGGAGAGGSRSRHHWPPPVHVPAELQESAEMAPKHLLCPITHHILTEPAVTSTGATYERSAIVEWLTKAGKDPLTGHPLSPNEVFPNIVMYTVVEEYVRDHAKKPAAVVEAQS